MCKILSSGLWPRVRAVASKASRRQAAIAFVTGDLIGFKKDDLLITDASEAVIRSGATDAKLLLKLHRRGVTVMCCPNLHAKVLLLGDCAVVGSSNLSASSRDRLVEAAILTDSASAVSGVASLIEQLRRQSEELKLPKLQLLAKIKVNRRGFIPGQPSSRKRKPRVAVLGNTTWLSGVYDMALKQSPAEKELIKKTALRLANAHKLTQSSIEWIRWDNSGAFSRKCRPGDSLIQICSPEASARPTYVLRLVPVLDRQRLGRRTFIFVPRPRGRSASISWGRFRRLLSRVGGPSRISGNTERALRPEIASLIQEQWSQAR